MGHVRQRIPGRPLARPRGRGKGRKHGPGFYTPSLNNHRQRAEQGKKLPPGWRGDLSVHARLRDGNLCLSLPLSLSLSLSLPKIPEQKERRMSVSNYDENSTVPCVFLRICGAFPFPCLPRLHH
jgi:hypothetical protein